MKNKALTGSVESLALSHVVHIPVDGNQHTLIFTRTIIFLQLFHSKVPLLQFGKRGLFGLAGWHKIATLYDFVEQHPDYDDEGDVEGAPNYLVYDLT